MNRYHNRFRQVMARLTPGARAVLLVYLVSFVLMLIPPVASFLALHLLLVPSLAIGPEPWRIVTAPLIEYAGDPIGGLLQLVFLGLLLYSLGRHIEQRLGTARWLRSLAISVLLSSLAAALLGRVLESARDHVVLLGSLPAFVATLTAFTAIHGDAQVLPWGVSRPVSARLLTWVLLAILAASSLFTRRWPELAAMIVAALGGYHIGTGIRFAPVLRARALLKEWQLRRARRRYQVFDGGRSRPSGWRGPSQGQGGAPGSGGPGGTGGPRGNDRRWVN